MFPGQDDIRETAIRPGVYRHYKGQLYIVLGLARHHETDERGVVYHGVEPHKREIPMWNWRPLTGIGGWFTSLTLDEIIEGRLLAVNTDRSMQLESQLSRGERFTFLYRINSTQVERTFVEP